MEKRTGYSLGRCGLLALRSTNHILPSVGRIMGILRLSVQASREMTKIIGKGLGPKPRLFLFQSLRDWNDPG